MQFEPMINARINLFKAHHALSNLPDDKLFEFFVNDVILRSHQPDVGISEEAILDECSVGGADDMGIDGLAIKVNGIFVSTKQDIDELVELNKQISIEFLFIQSKNKDKLDSGEYGKFADGIIDFLADEHHEPHNEKIQALLQLKDYLFSDDIILRWKQNPIVRIYYIIFGHWRDNKHFEAKANKLKQDIIALQSYGDAFFKYIDSTELKKMCGEIENSFSAVMTVIDDFSLTEVSGVNNSLVVLLAAPELIKMVTTDEQMLRQSLFTDNVRDYQGNTDINTDIMNTIQNSPSNFALLNNGITIVCTSVRTGNRKITLSNPQIVNGCQTCNVLFDAYTQGLDLSKVTLLAKIIATEKDEVTSAIIRGTNSQNVVYNEAFETTRDFHKNLEEFFTVMQSDDSPNRIYYERRSRQYARDNSIPSTRIIGLKALTQSFVSVFMQSPHFGTSHEAILLKKYKNSIYVDGQSFYPYYTAALMCLNFEKLKRDEKIVRALDSHKHHLLFIVSELIAGVCPSINSNKNIDAYCNKILEIVSDDTAYTAVIQESFSKLQKAIAEWVRKRGQQYRHGIKDNSAFTKFLLTYIRGGNLDKIEYDNPQPLVLRGRVVKARRDRNGYNYGFIQHSPEDVFFHERDNEKLDFSNIYGKTVLYEIFQDSLNGEDRAEILEVLTDESYLI